MTPFEARDVVKTSASRLGFDRCGIARAGPTPRFDRFEQALAQGWAGTMAYLARHRELRADPRQLLPGTQSLIVVALNYHQPAPDAAPPGATALTGRVARYAWGEDYHAVVKDRLRQLADALHDAAGQPIQTRICVDTAPVVEREWAAAAGVGWIGKNTLVLAPGLGSYTVLGVVLTTLAIAPDEPMPDHCGSCTACLEACPTGAFPVAYQMDAARCVSYLTIERRENPPAELAAHQGRWVFGCDICQEVCPHNRHTPTTTEPRFAARPPAPEVPLHDILNWSADDYRRLLKGSAGRRATLDMWQRNARIAQSNAGLV